MCVVKLTISLQHALLFLAPLISTFPVMLTLVGSIPVGHHKIMLKILLSLIKTIFKVTYIVFNNNVFISKVYCLHEVKW
jgi:hypothetical protein